MLRKLRVADQERADVLKQLDRVTARLREEIVAADRSRPNGWGWRNRIIGTVASLSRAKVFETLAVADLGDKIVDALHAVDVEPALYRIGTGTAGQVVLALSTEHPLDDPVGLAERIRSGLHGRELVIVPAATRKPTGSEQEQATALAVLAVPGAEVAVVDPTRRTKARST